MTKEELKRDIEIANAILARPLRQRKPWHWRDYRWLERERARLVRELEAFERPLAAAK
jgi:hypothetical protein